jgi:hypothetical protein
MEKFQELRGEARLRLKNADHLITMTYPLVRDTKLLMAAVENLAKALELSLTSVLTYERNLKRIPPFHEQLDSKLNIFSQKVAPRYNIDRSYIKLIQDMDGLVRAHKKSPVEFVRKDKFIIASESYELRQLTLQGAKEYVERAKRFIQDMETIVSKDEHLSRRRD